MNSYLVHNTRSGIDLGVYDGDTPAAAIAAMYLDAGCGPDGPDEEDTNEASGLMATEVFALRGDREGVTEQLLNLLGPGATREDAEAAIFGSAVDGSNCCYYWDSWSAAASAANA